MLNRATSRGTVSFADDLLARLEARDPWTVAHSRIVAARSAEIAKALNLPAEERKAIHEGALVHDIGKLELPEGLLEKPGPLTFDERRELQRHPEIGERIVRDADDETEIVPAVRHHHERWDGAGYPDRLSGEDIPLAARIVAVADAYANLTNPRYPEDRRANGAVLARVRGEAGAAFDPEVVQALERVLGRG